MGITNNIPPSRLIQPGVIDNTAARPASPFEGQCIFQKDTDQLLVWNGTAWVIPNSPAQNPMGLELVTTASFSAQSTIPVSNCFTSAYSNYRVLIIVDSANNDADRKIKLRFRTTSGDDVSAIYTFSSHMSGFGNTAFNRTNAAYGATEAIMYEHYYGVNSSTACLDIITPFDATKKTSASGPVRGVVAAEDTNGIFALVNSATSYTGFSFYTSAGTITGSYAVYGYRK